MFARQQRKRPEIYTDGKTRSPGETVAGTCAHINERGITERSKSSAILRRHHCTSNKVDSIRAVQGEHTLVVGIFGTKGVSPIPPTLCLTPSGQYLLSTLKHLQQGGGLKMHRKAAGGGFGADSFIERGCLRTEGSVQPRSSGLSLPQVSEVDQSDGTRQTLLSLAPKGSALPNSDHGGASNNVKSEHTFNSLFGRRGFFVEVGRLLALLRVLHLFPRLHGKQATNRLRQEKQSEKNSAGSRKSARGSRQKCTHVPVCACVCLFQIASKT